ncbi:MAG: glycosyltransferase, partial [Rhodanobacter sp.]
MNITHVVESLNRGGLERVVIDLVRAQQEAGDHCQVVCLFEPGSLAPELAVLGVPVKNCGKRRGLDLRAVLRARRFIREHQTEVLHTHNAISHYYAVLASLGLSLRYVINTRHGMGATRAVAKRNSRHANERGSRLEWLYGKAMRYTDTVATVCEMARKEFAQRSDIPASKLVAVPNGIRLDKFLPTSAAARQQLATTLGLPAETRLLGLVGRLTWAKDHATLIRAFAIVHEQMPDTALILIGDGPLKCSLVDQAAAAGLVDRVLLLGDRSDIPALLGAMDLFVMSSVTEGYSVALLEACAAGLPIVATRVGGNPEIVRDRINGILVPERSPDALAAAMM